MRAPRSRAAALLALLAVVAVACGQKDGVHVSSGGGAAAGGLAAGDTSGATGPGDATAGGGGEVAIDPATGAPIDPATGQPAAAGDPAAGGAAAGGDPAAGGAGGGAGGAGGGAQQGGGGQGATVGDTIVFGVHAPITGAAPLPASFGPASKVYPEYVNAKGGINGRKLQVVVVDDEYQPSVASRKCTEMVQQSKAFLLIGGGGTDQIQACARTAAQLGVPYLSAGVTERGMRGLKNYFAVSMSYAQQGPYLAKFMKETFPNLVDKPAMVYSDSPNFGDARDAFVGALPGVQEFKLPRDPSQSDLANAARSMCQSGVKIAYPLMAPTDWLFLAGQANTLCKIQWSGVGLTMGLNTVASTGCRANRAIDGATFFSPFPGVDKAESLDPEFAEAVKGKSWDDIYVALWASTKAIAKITEKAGEGLNPATFVQAAESTKNLATGLNPVLSYSPEEHFGASQVHILKADCDKGQYVTMATFASF